MFLTILRYHVREGHLQYLLKLRADLMAQDDDDYEPQAAAMDQVDKDRKKSAKNDSISCDLGFRYPLLQSIFAGIKNHQSLQVSVYHDRYLLKYRARYWLRYRA